MRRILDSIFRSLIRKGTLRVAYGDGTEARYGDGPPEVAVRFTTPKAERRVMLNPELALGEAYMDGGFVVEQGRIYEFLELALGEGAFYERLPFWVPAQAALRFLRRGIDHFNPERRAKRNVAHHYDLDSRLYGLFLDGDRQYSCAYFESPGQSLDDAQLAKKRHIAAKLLIEPGQRVLDIGSGWGGLGLYLAKTCGARVTGVTLSQEQLALSRGRADEQDLGGRVEFRLQDYRSVRERFDRIVSVGMFEHVGINHYETFFRKVRDLLAEDGVALLHTIGRSDGPGATNPWIRRYIFPGAYIPALSEMMPVIERSGLVATDIEILRLHYAETLRAWRERFLARWDEAKALYDERFCRMWEFYLAISELSFRRQWLVVFQIQMARRQDAVPLTRDYILDAERRLRAREENGPRLRIAGE
jgi:cyclopropane-fatty-acyl-phospholipid synthase